MTPQFSYLSHPATLAPGESINGSARVLDLKGLKGINPTSIHTAIQLEGGHTLNQPKGTVVLWFFALEDLAASFVSENMKMQNEFFDNYTFLSDFEVPRDYPAANFCFMWNRFNEFRAKFFQGTVYPTLVGFEPPQKAWVQAVPFNYLQQHRWYQLGVTWDDEAKSASLFVNGVHCGASDIFNKDFKSDIASDTLYAGCPALTMDLSSFAVATMGHSVVRPKLHRAAPYHMESLRITVRHLRHLGYRSIGMAMEKSQDERNGTNWTAAFLDYQQTLPANSRIPLFYTYSAKDTDLAAWITRYRPEVIISGNSQVLPKLEAMGLAVPADIGLAVLDLATTDSDISGIDQMPELVGSAAMDMIVAQIQRNEHGVPAQTKLLLTEGIWVPGKTLRKIEKNSRLSSIPR